MIKKIIIVIEVAVALILFFSLLTSALAAFPSTYTNWVPGTVITSAWLNTVEQLLTSSTNPLGSLYNVATTTGNIAIASSSTGWNGLLVGATGKCLTASSTATLGVSWETCAGGGITISTPIFINAIPFFTGSSSVQSNSGLTFVSSTGVLAFPTSTFTNASGTRLSLTDYLTAPSSTITSLSMGNGSSTGAFDVTNRISFGNSSSSGGITIATIQATGQSVLTNTSSSNINASGYVTISGQTTFGNASGTNAGLTGYLYSANASTSNVSSTKIDVSTNLRFPGFTGTKCLHTDANGNATTTSADCGTGGGTTVTPPVELNISNVSLGDSNFASMNWTTSTGADGMTASLGFLALASGTASSSMNFGPFRMASGTISCSWTQATSSPTSNAAAAKINFWTATSTNTSSSSLPLAYSTSTCGTATVAYATTTRLFQSITTNQCNGITSTIPYDIWLIIERQQATGVDEIDLESCHAY